MIELPKARYQAAAAAVVFFFTFFLSYHSGGVGKKKKKKEIQAAGYFLPAPFVTWYRQKGNKILSSTFYCQFQIAFFPTFVG